MSAIRQYARADALAFGCGQFEIIVKLLDIFRVRVKARLHVADPALHLDKCGPVQ